jgi:single-strand DNA-binding protein
MNKIIISGRLTKDPDVRYTQSGKAVASFTVAVNRRFSKEQQTADFINCVVWDKLAEICADHIAKGSQVIVEGRLQVRTYDAQDGTKRYVTEIVANEVEFTGGKPVDKSGADQFGSQVGSDEEVPF